jgi:hypothetical protein
MSTTFSSDEFNQDIGRVKRVSEAGPVFITDRGRPTHVLMTFMEHQRVTGKKKKHFRSCGYEGCWRN